MQTSEIKKQAKQFILVNKYHPLTIYTLILAVAVLFLVVGYYFLWLGIALGAVFFVLMAPLSYSSADYYMRSYNLKTYENYSIFQGYKSGNFLRSILLRLIKLGMGIGLTAFLIVPGIIYFVKTSMSWFLLYNHKNLSAWDSVVASNSLLKGNNKKFFFFTLSFVGWFLLGILTAGIAFIYVLPYYHTAKSIFFRRVLLGVDDNMDLNMELKDKNAAANRPNAHQPHAHQLHAHQPAGNFSYPGTKAQASAKEEKYEPTATSFKKHRTTAGVDDTQTTKTNPNEIKSNANNNTSHMTEHESLDEVVEVSDVLKMINGEPIEEFADSNNSEDDAKYYDTQIYKELEILQNESFDQFKERLLNTRKAIEKKKLDEIELMIQKEQEAEEQARLQAELDEELKAEQARLQAEIDEELRAQAELEEQMKRENDERIKMEEEIAAHEKVIAEAAVREKVRKEAEASAKARIAAMQAAKESKMAKNDKQNADENEKTSLDAEVNADDSTLNEQSTEQAQDIDESVDNVEQEQALESELESKQEPSIEQSPQELSQEAAPQAESVESTESEPMAKEKESTAQEIKAKPSGGVPPVGAKPKMTREEIIEKLRKEREKK